MESAVVTRFDPPGTGILSVASALPRHRVRIEELADRFRIDLGVLRERLGLLEKCIARDDDEHPADFCTRAARAALRALGATAEDVGLVVSAGVSRDYLPSWSVALEVIDRLQLRRALGYDLSLGCSAPILAMSQACAPRTYGRPPLSIVVTAERWAHTISPDVPFPLALIAHADGGGACVLGPGANHTIRAAALRVEASYNDYLLIPGGGTREPASSDTIAANRHFRTTPRHSDQSLVDHYVAGYLDAIHCALSGLSPDRRSIQLLVMNQVRPVMRERIRSGLGIPEERAITTYPRLGHVGGADIFIGLEAAVRARRLRRGTTILASSTVTSFGAIALEGLEDAGVSIAREE